MLAVELSKVVLHGEVIKSHIRIHQGNWSQPRNETKGTSKLLPKVLKEQSAVAKHAWELDHTLTWKESKLITPINNYFAKKARESINLQTPNNLTGRQTPRCYLDCSFALCSLELLNVSLVDCNV